MKGAIPGTSLAAAQAAIRLLMTDAASIVRPATGAVTDGTQPAASPTTITASVVCSVADASSEEVAVFAEGKAIVGAVSMTFPVGTNILVGDTVTIDSRAYAVKAVQARRSDNLAVYVFGVEVA